MSPSINIGGNSISSITIDGQEVQEVTIDGQVAYIAIPDTPVSNSNLINWWPMENDGRDEKGSADFNAVNGASFKSSGGTPDVFTQTFDGGRAEFNNGTSDSADHLDSGTKIIKNSLGSFTVTAWVYPRAIATSHDGASAKSGGSQILVQAESAAGNDNYGMGLSEQDGIGFHLDNNSNTNLFTNTTIPLNEWMHVATSWDGSTMRIYQNGSLEASNNVGGSINSQKTVPMRTHRVDGNNPDPALDGFSDDLRIYDTNLSDSQISQIYENTKPR
jgi:hypothetical protein